ncbi:NAD(P)H-quinone oxidoreductase [Sphingomonas bacterium]|uniref:NAD(P)H-quinone oxidoreductase n=1 Tax=Sphingomonas bacterium TaxID=1895847 RepID=UPI0020C6EF82|nr:NAD(P)H-quinone oxidoreductase [Sphingomonas bacterium]
MNAVVIAGGKGNAQALHLDKVAAPEVRDGDLVIAVRAAGVNRPDVFQRVGLYPPPPGASETLGLEVAGEVMRAAGRWSVGDRVCALLGGGGYAQIATCDPRHALPVPRELTFEEAAGLPETVFTVFANVFQLGGLRRGETLLVHGASSGIGVTAIQMAKAAGATVIATSRGAAKADAAARLGADLSIDASKQDYVEAVKRHGGADVVLNMVGGDTFAKDLETLNTDGRIVFIAALGGAEVTLPIFTLMQKRAVVTGSTLRGRSADEKAALASEIERMVWPWIEDGRFKPVIDTVLPFARAAEAHERMEAGEHTGKIVLDVGAG